MPSHANPSASVRPTGENVTSVKNTLCLRAIRRMSKWRPQCARVWPRDLAALEGPRNRQNARHQKRAAATCWPRCIAAGTRQLLFKCNLCGKFKLFVFKTATQGRQRPAFTGSLLVPPLKKKPTAHRYLSHPPPPAGKIFENSAEPLQPCDTVVRGSVRADTTSFVAFSGMQLMTNV